MRRTADTLFLGPVVKSPPGYGFHYLQAGAAPIFLPYPTKPQAFKGRAQVYELGAYIINDMVLFNAIARSLSEERMLTEQKHTVKLISPNEEIA